jgi:pimeloyl-ACP methyl ester carboxylesterase
MASSAFSPDSAPQHEPVQIDVRVPSGTLRAHRFGAPGGKLVIACHGLSANSRSYDAIGAALGKGDRTVVALDLRGRGYSPITAPGTYGWPAHARDLVAAAEALGADQFDFVGHSMGAFIGLEVAHIAKKRLRRLALIDACGLPEPASLPPILAAVQRLGHSHADADTYVSAVRKLGIIEPWAPTWETHYRYDLIPAERGGVCARTDRAAVFEDITYGSMQDPKERWLGIFCPTLLLRAARKLGDGFLVSLADRDKFVATLPRATSVDIDANHYGIMTSPETISALETFFA